jgi:hypothetical protein
MMAEPPAADRTGGYILRQAPLWLMAVRTPAQPRSQSVAAFPVADTQVTADMVGNLVTSLAAGGRA